MPSLSVKGTIKEIFPEKKVSEKFRTREFVITDNTSSKYPQHIILQVTQDKCDVLDQYGIGDEITALFNVRGREWNSKYYNTLDVWKIEGVGRPAVSNHQASNDYTGPSSGYQESDLPF